MCLTKQAMFVKIYVEMEFRLDQRQIEIKKRELIVSVVFVSINLVIGAVGIFGPKPSIARSIASVSYAFAFGLFIKYLLKDFARTRHNMLAHRLIIEGNQLILQRDNGNAIFYLHDIYSIRCKIKKGSVVSILVDIDKHVGFKIKGYERMDAIMNLLKKSVPSSRITFSGGIF